MISYFDEGFEFQNKNKLLLTSYFLPADHDINENYFKYKANVLKLLYSLRKKKKYCATKQK